MKRDGALFAAEEPMRPAAAVHDVTMRFREHNALDGVSVDFEENVITGLLGRNGAGKTTMMQLLAGHLLPTSGRVEVFGTNPYENESALQQMSLVKENQKYPEYFRVIDAMSAAAMLFPNWDAAYAESLLTDFDLPRKRRIKKLSRGMLSVVGIVIGLASRAPLTFFDEPYLGLDAVARQMFYDRLIADYSEHPRTIVLSTHLIEEIADLLEHVVLIERGRLLADADADDLRARALSVSGRSERVDQFLVGRDLLRREGVGQLSRAVVGGRGRHDRDEATALGLEVEAVSLQQLVVALTNHAGAISPANPSSSEPADLEEVSR